MSTYKVTLGEAIIHSLEVKAESQKEAIELAKQLISNLDDYVLQDEYNYAVDTAGYDDYEEAELCEEHGVIC